MAPKHNHHIALTEPLARFVERQVADRRYASASEVVRADLRLPIEREQAGAQLTGQDGQAHE